MTGRKAHASLILRQLHEFIHLILRLRHLTEVKCDPSRHSLPSCPMRETAPTRFHIDEIVADHGPVQCVLNRCLRVATACLS